MCERERDAYRVLVGKTERKEPRGRPKRRWEDNVKNVCLRMEWGHGLLVYCTDSVYGQVTEACANGVKNPTMRFNIIIASATQIFHLLSSLRVFNHEFARILHLVRATCPISIVVLDLISSITFAEE
jgi:hypothetical protein